MSGAPHPVGGNVTAAVLNDRVKVYARRTNEIDVVSSVTETDLLKDSGGTALSIGANHLSTDRLIRVELHGDLLNNTGGGQSLTLRLKLGGTTLISQGVGSVGASASRANLKLEAWIAALGATNSQFDRLEWWIASQISGTFATSTVDTTAARNLELTVELGLNSANYSFRKKYAIVELL